MNLSDLEEAIKVFQVFDATLKPQNSLVALSNLPKYLLTPTSDLYYYYIVLHYTTTANVIFTIVFFRVFIFRCLNGASQRGIK